MNFEFGWAWHFYYSSFDSSNFFWILTYVILLVVFVGCFFVPDIINVFCIRMVYSYSRKAPRQNGMSQQARSQEVVGLVAQKGLFEVHWPFLAFTKLHRAFGTFEKKRGLSYFPNDHNWFRSRVWRFVPEFNIWIKKLQSYSEVDRSKATWTFDWLGFWKKSTYRLRCLKYEKSFAVNYLC